MDGNDVVKHLIITGVKSTGYELGRGAYGRVFAVEYNGITCAAKKIHSALLDIETSNETKKIPTGVSPTQ